MGRTQSSFNTLDIKNILSLGQEICKKNYIEKKELVFYVRSFKGLNYKLSGQLEVAEILHHPHYNKGEELCNLNTKNKNIFCQFYVH